VKLGIIVGTWDGSAEQAHEIMSVAREAERCGYDIVWVPELYGADAVSVMAWLAAGTSAIRIGSAVMQIPARPPTTTAMSVVTLAALFGPRIVLGLGVSGPQVSEGWYGQPWRDPIGRTREYIDVIRLAMSRQPVAFHGSHLQLPLTPGQRPLKLVVKNPVQVPIFLAAIGPRNVELAAEVADGWLPALVLPEQFAGPRRAFVAAAEKFGRRADDITVACSTAAVINDDLAAARDVYRPYLALLVGGMGTRQHNFYRTLVSGYGFAKEAAAVTEAYLAGQRREAEAMVPAELIDGVALVGSRQRVAARLEAFAAAGIDILSIAPAGRSLEEKLAVVRSVAELNASG
jgi:F420-dependent oxidoreductase-like protein